MKRLHYNLLAIALSSITATSVWSQQKVEYFWDSDPGVGKGQVLQNFTGSEAIVSTSLDASKLSEGIHHLGLRALNDGRFSATYYRSFYVPPKEEGFIRIEYAWDSAPALGKGTALVFSSGSNVDLTQSLSVRGLKTGIHTLYIRALSTNHHSLTYTRSFYVPPKAEGITRIEYAWDSAPTLGKGTALTFTSGSTVDLTQSLSVSGLKTGMHTLYIRALSTNHHSQTYTRSFYVPPTEQKVNAVEYYFDNDPGVGKATHVAAFLNDESLDMAFNVDTDGLSEGVHHIGIRTLTDATWSDTKVRQFLVRKVENDEVVRLEYFWNNDPGFGKAYSVDITPGKEVTIDFEADMTALPEGTHSLGLRAQSKSGHWSAITSVYDILFEGWDPLQEYLNSLHDTQDVLTDGNYTRQFLNTDWQSLYVPFSLDYSDWSDKFEVASLSKFCQYDDDADGETERQELEAVILRSGSATLKANHPYLIRAKEPGTYCIPVDDSKMVAEKVNTVTYKADAARMSITGNYSNRNGLNSADMYRLMGGSLFVPTNDDEVLPPYRWYAKIENPDKKSKVRIIFVDNTTDISSAPVVWDDDVIGNRKVYDLQGRRVNVCENTKLSSLPKGVYIINNRKYIIK